MDVSLVSSNHPHDSTSPKFSIPDGTVEGTISSTVSPRTLPSSTDDNFQLEEPWPQFQLLNPLAASMSMEAPPLMYQYAKGPGAGPATDNTVIVDAVGELSNGQGFASEFQSDQFMPFSNVPPTYPYPFMNESLETPLAGAPENNVPMPPQGNVSLSMEPQLASKEASPLRDLQCSMRSLESRWLDTLEAQLPATDMAASSTYSALPLDLDYRSELKGQDQDQFQYSSENSSVSDYIPGTYEFPATSGEARAFAERQLDEKGDQSHGGATSQQSQTTAFVVRESSSESLPVSAPPSRPRAASATQRSTTRSTPLSLQSMATVRKRKQRGATMSIDQGQSKPLQIVQEDGQGGSIASADFVSPPRGARRKGPLSMAGRANAGMRRKNKDTCVQCRLNKRKVYSYHSLGEYNNANLTSVMATPRVMLAAPRFTNSRVLGLVSRVLWNMEPAIISVCNLPL